MCFDICTINIRVSILQSQVRFNRVPEKVPEKVPAEPDQVQQGSEEG